MSAITAMVGGDFGPPAKIQESNPIGTLGSDVQPGSVADSRHGAVQPISGDFGAGGSGVESSANGGVRGSGEGRHRLVWQQCHRRPVHRRGQRRGARQIALQKLQNKGWGQYWNASTSSSPTSPAGTPTPRTPARRRSASSSFSTRHGRAPVSPSPSNPWACRSTLKPSTLRAGTATRRHGHFWQRQSPSLVPSWRDTLQRTQIIGAGEKGPEVTIPLNNPSRLKAMTDAYIRPNYPKGSDSLTFADTGQGQQVEVHIPIELRCRSPATPARATSVKW